MTQYNMLEAKNNLSKICKMIVDKDEDYVVIASNGKPLVKVIPYCNDNVVRIGIADGKYKIDMKKFDECNDEIEDMFYGD